MSSIIKNCRNCKSKSIANLFDLGKPRFTGKFPKLDEITEKEIMEEISKLKGEKTIIISTHKPSVLKYCDKIFDVKNNTIRKNL